MSVSIPDPLNINKLTSNQIITGAFQGKIINADVVNGRGMGAVIRASKIYLGDFLLEARIDGIYVITPTGVITKIELIDLTKGSLPPLVDLLPVAGEVREVTKALGGGPPGIGAGLGIVGNALGGGGALGGLPFIADAASRFIPALDGIGYQALSLANLSLLPASCNNPEFLQALDSLARFKNMASDSLMTVFQIASGLNIAETIANGANAVNLITGASGLAQITPFVAEKLGFDIHDIRLMSAVEQLTGPITRYFDMNNLPAIPTLTDLYLTSFYPAAVGKLEDYVLGDVLGAGTRQQIADANKLFQDVKTGLVTVGSIKNWITSKYPST